MPETIDRGLADIGNSRIKLGLLRADGTIAHELALDLDERDRWHAALRDTAYAQPGLEWAIGTVNSAGSKLFEDMVQRLGAGFIRWYRSAADVRVSHRLTAPLKTGADRALAVCAALEALPRGTAGIVILCGTAVTVESIDANGVWLGGAIAAGLRVLRRALAEGTAQLPLVGPSEFSPPCLGRDTEAAIAAGLHWGLVGAVRELIARQKAALGDSKTSILWSGGDAHWLAREIGGAAARVDDALVLRGLALQSGSRDNNS